MAVQERTPEVQAEIGAAVDSVKDMPEEQLVAELRNRGMELSGEESKSWMGKKLRYVLQQEVLKRHGLQETAKMSERHAEVDAGQSEATEEKKPGRKKMVKTGTFQLELGEDGNIGREGSVKHGVLNILRGLEGPFSYEQFESAVATTMEWDPEKETFGRNTRFPSLSAASNAWFSELKNKAKVIVQVEAA